GDWLKRHDRFASLTNRLDCSLEPGRGNNRAQFAGGIHHYRYLGPAGHCFAVNPRDVGRSLCALLADAHLSGVTSHTHITDIDVVAPTGEIGSGITPDPDVA